MQTVRIVFLVLVLGLVTSPVESLADKSSVKIEAPRVVEKGSEITIKIHVFHKGNNFAHYTNWVDVKINDETVQRWEFSAFNRPEAENFTREVTYTVTGPTKIVAQANCNLHGSTGETTWSVTLAPEEKGQLHQEEGEGKEP
jgi:desulfoferrodoxin (superoxide reductase-like protein)